MDEQTTTQMPKPASKFKSFITDRVAPIAGDVLDFVGDVTGVEAIERLGEFLNKNKARSAEMRQLISDFDKFRLEWELEMTRLQIGAITDQLKNEVTDRVSARSRESDWTSKTGKRDWVMASVVVTGLLLFISTIFALVFVDIPEANQRLADMCFGAVMSIGASIFNYYIGTSKSSRTKDETIKLFADAKSQFE